MTLVWTLLAFFVSAFTGVDLVIDVLVSELRTHSVRCVLVLVGALPSSLRNSPLDDGTAALMPA